MLREYFTILLHVVHAYVVRALLSVAMLASSCVFAAEAEYLPDDPASCLLCHADGGSVPAEGVMHGAHAIVSNHAAPLAPGKQGCQSCHGPSATHLGQDANGKRIKPPVAFGRNQPATNQNSVCLGCHENETGHKWSGSPHEFAEVPCTGCHQLHVGQDRSLGSDNINSLCTDCHPRQQAESLSASSHPLRSGQITCIDCHAPHGGSGPSALIQSSLNEQCFTCHAEKRGPFLWEHAPVSEDCSNCHKPHGSNHRNLLQARTPFLCQQCHLAAFHPSNAESGLGIPPRGAATNLLGRDCSNCHVQVHGSNHPSGSGLTR